MYPGYHRLGSRDWLKNDEATTYGQWLGGWTFDEGLPPVNPPALRTVGNAKCIERGGGGGTDTVSPDGLEQWLPSGCYNPVPPGPCKRIRQCPDQAYLSLIMAYVWENPSLALAVGQAFAGTGAVGTMFMPLESDRFSRSLVVIRGDTCYCWIDGTRNAGQLLAQAYGTAFGPKYYHFYRTTPIYHDFATVCLRRLSAAGAADCTKFLIVGHSYGGATAAVVAARLKSLFPDAEVAVMTEGAPRAGDSQLITVLKKVCQLHIRRPHDPIPSIREL